MLAPLALDVPGQYDGYNQGSILKSWLLIKEVVDVCCSPASKADRGENP
jgi:hypothetical protein